MNFDFARFVYIDISSVHFTFELGNAFYVGRKYECKWI